MAKKKEKATSNIKDTQVRTIYDEDENFVIALHASGRYVHIEAREGWRISPDDCDYIATQLQAVAEAARNNQDTEEDRLDD